MPWSVWKKAGSRIAFVYLILYTIPLFDPLWTSIVPPVGKLFAVEAIRRTRSGSGDTAFHWMQMAVTLALSLTVASLWTLLDRRRENDRRLALGLHVLVRLALGIALISYGSAKVIQGQFPPPSLIRLEQPMGQFSPMGLLWTFMGASRPYNLVTGFAEMIPGILLFFPRTALLGALIAAGVLLNVFALNLCYDVPVKLYSLHLFGMAIFVAAPSGRRLVDFFLRGESPPAAIPDLRFQRTAFWLKIAALLLVTGGGLWSASRNVTGSTAAGASVRGIWDVKEYRAAETPAPLAPGERWKRIALDDRDHRAAIQFEDGTSRHVSFNIDEDSRQFHLDDIELSFSSTAPGELTLTGGVSSRKVVALLRRDPRATLLIDRGFHWVSEFPFNR